MNLYPASHEKKKVADAYCWIDGVAEDCEAGGTFCNPLSDLILTGATHRNALKESIDNLDMRNAGTEYETLLREYRYKYGVWLEHWRAAAADVAAVGLDDKQVTYGFWHENVRLPNEVTKAYKWFETAERVIKPADMDWEHLDKYSRAAADRSRLTCRCGV